jgi:hypothetical protein
MNKTGKILIGIALAAIVLLALRVVPGLLNPPSDDVLVRQALQESIDASRDGRPGGVLDVLSEQFRINEMEPTRRQVMQAVRDNRPEVEVPDQRVLVTGDEARIVSPITVTIRRGPFSMDRTIPEVTILFRREDDTQWLLIPRRRWKLAEVQVPEGGLAEFLGS